MAVYSKRFTIASRNTEPVSTSVENGGLAATIFLSGAGPKKQVMGLIGKLIGVGAVVGLVYLARKAKSVADKFDFTIVGYGLPKVSNWVIELPIQMRFVNPTPLPVPIQQLEVHVYVNTGNAWQEVALVNQPLTIEGGTSEQTINAHLDVTAIFGNILDVLKTSFVNKSLQVRTDVTIVIAGVAFPQDPYIQSIQLPAP